MPTSVFAAESCVTDTAEGITVQLRGGEAWLADDPFVKQRPDLFVKEPPVEYLGRTVHPSVVEQATAAPGERRNAKRA